MRTINKICQKVLSLIIIVFSVFSYSQTNAEYQINSEVYPPPYFNSKKTKQVNYNKYYVRAVYYSNKNLKEEGFLKLDESKIYFKKKLTDLPTKIKTEEIKSITIGLDSFFTSSNFYYKNKLKKKPEFLQYLTETNNHIFAKHFRFSPGKIESTILVKNKKEDAAWANFKNKKHFNSQALLYFGHIPHLKANIENKKYSLSDLMNLIKTTEYFEKLENKQDLYFDNNWNEIKQSKNFAYKAIISNKTKSVLTFEYFNNESKIFEVNYSSFFPHIKTGHYKSFYKNGKTREDTHFKKNRIIDYKVFNEEETLIKHYKDLAKGKDSVLVKNRNYGNNSRKKYTYSDKKPEIKFIVLLDTLGNNIVNKEGNFRHYTKDSISGELYTNIYKNHVLIKSYPLKEEGTFHKPTKNDSFNIYNLNNELSSTQESKTKEKLSKFSTLLNSQKDTLKLKNINSKNPKTESLVKSFMNSEFSKETPVMPKEKKKKKKLSQSQLLFQQQLMQQQIFNNLNR